MDWQAIQAIGEMIAAGGVIVSLVYLSIQVRQNTRSNEAAVSQELLASYVALLSFAWESPHGAHLYAHAIWGSWEELSIEEQAAGRQMWIGALRMFEHAFLQRQAGLLSTGTWTGWENQLLLSSELPGFQSVWPGVRILLNPSFVAYVDGSSGKSAEIASRYREALTPGGVKLRGLGDIVPPSTS